MKTQVQLENSFTEIANSAAKNSGGKVVVLIDRGLMDGSAFINDRQWANLMDEMNVTEKMLKEDRYDAVIHLATAADGARDFYVTQQEGESRYEDFEQAIQ